MDLGVASLAMRLQKFVDMPAHVAICTIALLAAVAAENTIKGDSVRFLRYPLAVLVGAVAGAMIFEILGPHSPHSSELMSHLADSALAEELLSVAPSLLKAMYLCLLVIALHAIFEANRRAVAALHAAQLIALDAENEVFEGELRAMQTRVDPDLLFNSLDDIDAAYALDPASGQARLDALIRFLRAALPSRSAAIPTVAHELELTEAYLALLVASHMMQARLEFAADPDTLDERIAPMLLLPLVRWALDGRFAEELRVGVRRRAAVSGESAACMELRIDSSLKHPPTEGAAALEVLRYRLRRLFGDNAQLFATSTGVRRRAVVELPLGCERSFTVE
jgi:hypothetical protein